MAFRKNLKRNPSGRNQFNTEKATWDPSENKGQMSLAPGSEEYKEFVEDREKNAPSAPSDEFHEDLAAHNTDYRADMDEKTAAKRDETIGNRKYRNQQMKRGYLYGLAKEAEDKAASTPDTRDDALAHKLRFDREPPASTIVYDDGVTPDPDVMDDKIFNDEFLPKEWDDEFGK